MTGRRGERWAKERDLGGWGVKGGVRSAVVQRTIAGTGAYRRGGECTTPTFGRSKAFDDTTSKVVGEISTAMCFYRRFQKYSHINTSLRSARKLSTIPWGLPPSHALFVLFCVVLFVGSNLLHPEAFGLLIFWVQALCDVYVFFLCVCPTWFSFYVFRIVCVSKTKSYFLCFSLFVFRFYCVSKTKNCCRK